MGLPAQDQPYVEQVEAFFVSTIRKGLMLRATDVEVIRDWQARQVPLEVVRRGIIAGVREFLLSSDPNEPIPATLKYYRTRVESEYEVHQRAVERGLIFGTSMDAAAVPDLLDRAKDLLQKWTADEAIATRKAVFEGALARLGSADEDESTLALLESLDEFIAQALIETAPGPTADRIRRHIEQGLQDAVSRGLGRTAMDDVERSAVLESVAEEFGYLGLVKTLVDTAA